MSTRDYYLANIGIDQWVLRAPIKKIFENCKISGPINASVLVLIFADHLTNQEQQLFESILNALSLTLNEVRIIHVDDKVADSSLIRTFISNQHRQVWIIGTDLVNIDESWIVTDCLKTLLQNPIKKKQLFNKFKSTK